MNRRLSVLMIANSINYRRRGGLSRHTYELSKALQRLGCEVHVFCMDKPENREVNLDNKLLVPCLSAPFFDLVSFNMNMLRKIKSYDIDIVHSQAGHGFIFGLARGKPLVVTVHGTTVRIIRSVPELKYHILPYATVLIERHTLLQADKIIAVSQSVIEDLSSDYGIEKEKIEFVPHGVDTEKFNPHLAGDAIREKYDVRGPLLLCVSRLQPERFAQKLIPMFGNVAKEIPNATLIVVGDGSLRPSLEAARSHSGLSKNIILAGAQDDDLPYFYAAADLYILPGIHPPATKEMTVLEAMASGKAVVYVNRIQKGLNHSYEPDKDAQDKGIIAVEDHKEFANCAVNLLRDEKKRRALGLAARDAVVSNFSWEKAAEKTINVYESLL